MKMRIILLALAALWAFSQIAVSMRFSKHQCRAENDTQQVVIATEKRTLALLILSRLGETPRREAIRATWLSLPQPAGWRVLHFFIVCGASQDTSAPRRPFDYNGSDMVILPCIESYSNLSRKVVQAMMWISTFSDTNNVDYVAKTDSDVFVDLPLVLKLMEGMKRTKIWWGFVHQNMWPVRDIFDKNAELYYPLPTLPPYTVGVYYTLSIDIVRALSRALQSTLSMVLTNEDQTIGIALGRLGYSPIHDIRFQQWKSCTSRLLTLHPVTPEQMVLVYTYYVSSGTGNWCKALPEHLACPICHTCTAMTTENHWKTYWKCENHGASLVRRETLCNWYPDKLSLPINHQRMIDLRTGDFSRALSTVCGYNEEFCNWETLQVHVPSGYPVECADPDFVPHQTEARRSFILVWTTDARTFTSRHHRVIESAFLSHPASTVRIFSNTLDCSMFSQLLNDGFDVRVSRYNITRLAGSLPGAEWLRNITKWKEGPSFYAHMADFLRFVLLYRFGGTYLDFDALLTARLPAKSQNIIALEECDSLGHDFCMFLPEYGSSWEEPYKRRNFFYTPIGILSFEPGHPTLLMALREFRSYNPNLWPCGTVYLSRAFIHTRSIWKSWEVLGKDAFYPVSWQDSAIFLDDISLTSTGNKLEEIGRKSLSVHLWNKVTLKRQIMPGMLLHNLLDLYSLYAPVSVADHGSPIDTWGVYGAGCTGKNGIVKCICPARRCSWATNLNFAPVETATIFVSVQLSVKAAMPVRNGTSPSLYVDLALADGSHEWGLTNNFAHIPWKGQQYRSLSLHNSIGISQARVHLLCSKGWTCHWGPFKAVVLSDSNFLATHPRCLSPSAS